MDSSYTSGNPLLAINSLDLRSDGGFVEHSGIDSCFDVTMSSGLDITMDDAPPLDETEYYHNAPTPSPLRRLISPIGDHVFEAAAEMPSPIAEPSRSDNVGENASPASDTAPEVHEETSLLFNDLPLSDDLCEDLFSHEFDTHWITAYSINPEVFQTFTSPKKLENLTSHDVIRIGDQLAIIGTWTQQQQVDRVNAATILSYDVKTRYLPTVRIESDGVFQEDISKCHGPSFIVRAFNKIHRGETTVPVKAWKDLQLYREGEWVESLHYVRNSFHLWEEQRKAWDHRLQGTAPVTPKGKCKWNRRG